MILLFFGDLFLSLHACQVSQQAGVVRDFFFSQLSQHALLKCIPFCLNYFNFDPFFICLTGIIIWRWTLIYAMLFYVLWLFVKRLSQQIIQRHPHQDRLEKWKWKVLRHLRALGLTPWRIKLRSDRGMSFQSAGPMTTIARCWNREVRPREQQITMISRAKQTGGAGW